MFEVFIKETWAVIFMSELSMLRKVQWPIEMFEQTMCDDVLTHGKQQLRLWKSICSENQHKLHIILLYFCKWNKLFWKKKRYANNETECYFDKTENRPFYYSKCLSRYSTKLQSQHQQQLPNLVIRGPPPPSSYKVVFGSSLTDLIRTIGTNFLNSRFRRCYPSPRRGVKRGSDHSCSIDSIALFCTDL